MNQKLAKKVNKETKKRRLEAIKEMYACKPWYIPKPIWKFLFVKIFAR
jgi:hypothetical protein